MFDLMIHLDFVVPELFPCVIFREANAALQQTHTLGLGQQAMASKKVNHIPVE